MRVYVHRAFRGVARFKKNVGNFSGLLENVDLRISKFEEQPEYVRAFWVFRSSIKLPWNPRIAAGGYTTHVFNNVRNASIPLMPDCCCQWQLARALASW